MKLTFKEEQNFRKSWVLLILLAINGIPIYGIYQQVVLGKPFGDNPSSDMGLYFFLAFTIGLFLFFWIIKLSTEIDDFQIKMKFFPLSIKTFKWSDIESAKVVNYGFIGGWGIRLWTKFGTVYNTSGNIGLAIKLKNGKKFLIGTQKESELKSFITNQLKAEKTSDLNL
tara:strand:- start:102673 stop:103179 length:507 start_codon:yes stop_codon:yes gene_type:complete